jgi:hypothetical protein
MMKPTETAPEIPVAAPAATVAAPPPPARPGRARRHHAAKGTPAAPSPRAADADENDVPLFQE